MNYDAIENPIVFGKLPTGGLVTIRLVMFPGNTELALVPGNQVCQETAIPGYYQWSFGLLQRSLLPPLTPNHQITVLYVMQNADGYQFSGKVILGHFPELIRRTYGIVQVPL